MANERKAFCKAKASEQRVRKKLFFCFFWWEMLSSQEIRNRCARGHIHIHAPHWKTRVFNFQTWKRLLLNGRRNENLACFLQAISRELMELWQAAWAHLAIEMYSTSTQSVGACFKGVQNGNLHYSHSSKNGKSNLVYSTAKIWLFPFQKLKIEITGYLYFIIYFIKQSLNLALSSCFSFDVIIFSNAKKTSISSQVTNYYSCFISWSSFLVIPNGNTVKPAL